MATVEFIYWAGVRIVVGCLPSKALLRNARRAYCHHMREATTTPLNTAVLGSSALGIATIGVFYLVAPHLLLDVYGVEVDSASEANIFRSGSGSLFVALAVVFGLGAARPRYTWTSLVVLLASMSGLAVGRVVSIMVDGRPHPVLIAVLVIEVCYATAAAVLVRRAGRRTT